MLSVILIRAHNILMIWRKNFWCDSIGSSHRSYNFKIRKINKFRYSTRLNIRWRQKSFLVSLIAFKAIPRVKFWMHLDFILSWLLYLTLLACKHRVWWWLFIIRLLLTLVTSLLAHWLIFLLLTLRHWRVVISNLVYFLISNKVY